MSNRLYSPRKGDKITISKEDQKMIASLDAEVKISGYYDYMVVWNSEDEEFLNNQKDYLNKMQMISMTATPKLDKNKYKFYDVHYKLLRRLYLEDDLADGCVTMGYKRPFGNSNVEGDVIQSLIELGIKDNFDESYELCNEVLREFVTFIIDFYKGGYELLISDFDALENKLASFSYNENMDIFREVGLKDEYLHSYLSSWVPSISAMRERKLNELGIYEK